MKQFEITFFYTKTSREHILNALSKRKKMLQKVVKKSSQKMLKSVVSSEP